MNEYQSSKGEHGEKLRLASPTIYEIISTEGREELARPDQSLAWSGFVAGILITFSLFGEAYIRHHVPAAGNYYLLENLGYTFGFIIVILGRFQLFTENTVTVVLPVLEDKSWKSLRDTARVWLIVILTNFVGTFFVATLICQFNFIDHGLMDVLVDISKHAVVRDPSEVFWLGIPAGFLIATLVWMLPSSETFEFWVIILMTYIIAIGDFAHIIAGSVEAFILLQKSIISIPECLSYLASAAGGNILGGTGLFALMAYAQVSREMKEDKEK